MFVNTGFNFVNKDQICEVYVSERGGVLNEWTVELIMTNNEKSRLHFDSKLKAQRWLLRELGIRSNRG